MTEADDGLPVPCGGIVADKYRVERLVGRGGMGCVVEATHLQLLQRVAIKFLLEDQSDAGTATRLLREARAAVALQSEHVARVMDIGTLPSGMPFLVMELLEGQTLASRLSGGRTLAVDEVVWMAMQACKALADAHRAGIIHRDVKPGNIFLARADGRVVTKLLDFGIAKVKDPGIAVEEHLTSSEHTLGTPRYMSPEQLTASSSVDARSDVWSLGVVLYECLAGSTPFPRGTAFEIGAQILSGNVARIAAARPEVPPTVDAIIARCLERNAAARYADASEVIAALEHSGVTPRAIAIDPDREPPLLAPTRLGLGSAARSLPATRVAPLVAPGTVVMPVAPAAVPEPAARVPMRSTGVLLVVGAVALVALAGGIAVARQQKPVAAATMPAPTSPPSELSVAAPTAPTTSAAPLATPDVPAPRSSGAARRPVARPPMTRPPNER
ncbi:MAG TPA: protein kinase [Labilithrix sp.]|nr:protein kinase [Labilithrix sp.]